MAREPVADALSRQLATAIRWATRLEQELADATDGHTTDAVYGVWSRRIAAAHAELKLAHQRIVDLERALLHHRAVTDQPSDADLQLWRVL